MIEIALLFSRILRTLSEILINEPNSYPVFCAELLLLLEESCEITSEEFPGIISFHNSWLESVIASYNDPTEYSDNEEERLILNSFKRLKNTLNDYLIKEESL